MTKKAVIQHHHISYKPEVVVPLFKSEHWAITQMLRRKKCSMGFIKSLKVFVALNESQAEDLDRKREKDETKMD